MVHKIKLLNKIKIPILFGVIFRTLMEKLSSLAFFGILLIQGCAKDAPKLEIIITDETLKVYSANGTVLDYFIRPQCPLNDSSYYCRSGFINHLSSPNGVILTDGFPVGHTHQHGIFHAWTNTLYRGVKSDYWNQKDQTGFIEHHQIIDHKILQNKVLFTTELLVQPKAQPPVLKETWKTTVAAYEAYNQIDLEITQTNISSDTFFLNKYRYGAFGIRGSKHWNDKDSLHFQNPPNFLTNETNNRTEANHSRPNWTAIFGKVNGKTAGLAVIGHPQNLNHPQPIRVSPDMPYFCLNPAILDGFFIEPQGNYQAKYRIVTFDGIPDMTWLDEMKVNYSSPKEF